MGCFLGCFGASKDDKNRHKIVHLPHNNPNFGKQYSPVNQAAVAKPELIEEPINSSVSEFGVKPVEEKLSLTNKEVSNFRDKQGQQSSVGARKKVTFDSNVKEYEHVSCNEAPETLEDEVKEAADITKLGKSPCTSECSSTLSSVGSFPLNHRYQNCRDSDDDDGLGCEISDLDDDDDDELYEDGDEEAYDAEYSEDDYYSRRVSEISSRSSLESETKSSVTYGANEPLREETKIPLEFHRGARDRAAYVNSVLNPVENTAQWKQLKAKRTSSLKPQKENILKSKPAENGPETNYTVAVDASLSTWLSSTTKTSPTKARSAVSEPTSPLDSMSSHGSNSAVLREERPILGALTMEELKQISPRRSPARTPNEKPLLGTVGTQWTHVQDSASASSFKGIPNTTRKYEDVSSII